MKKQQEEQQKQLNTESNTRLQKKERYDLLFVIRDINCMYLDTTISNYIELLNKKMHSSCFVNCFLQTKQTTRDDIHHDKKGQATGQSQAQQVQERQPSKAGRQSPANLLHPSKGQVQ